LQVHPNRENLLDDLVLQVGRDAVAVSHQTQLGELVVQPGGFGAGTAAAVAQLVGREGNHGGQRCPQITRRAITTSGTVTGVSEMITSTATIAATMQPDSHLRWNRAVQISGTKMTMPTPEVATGGQDQRQHRSCIGQRHQH
jgi:hypothetical protein